MNEADLAALVRQKLEEAVKERGHVNVLIAGRTGVGKSTLINAVFQGNYAETGQGRPVTASTREISKEGIPLTIFDTRGLEMKAFEQTSLELERLVRDRNSDRDPNRHIHVAWICIQEDGRRVEDAEVELHRMLSRLMPVIGVVTKARSDRSFRAEVQRLLPEAKNVVRVRALEEELDDGHRLPPSGLEELVQLTCELVPEGHRRAFASAQKASLELKKFRAQKVVMASVTAAVAAAASPIPFTDAALLVPIQVGMLAGITSCFGLPLSTAFLSTLVASVGGGTLMTLSGRAIVSNVLKLIPGAGYVAGTAIAATTAGSLTTALGQVYIATLVAAFHQNRGEAATAEQVAEQFKREAVRVLPLSGAR